MTEKKVLVKRNVYIREKDSRIKWAYKSTGETKPQDALIIWLSQAKDRGMYCCSVFCL
jgi:hypothetical protein